MGGGGRKLLKFITRYIILCCTVRYDKDDNCRSIRFCILCISQYTEMWFSSWKIHIFGSLDTLDAHFVLLMHRPEQTCQLLRQGHHQQEFPCHPQQLEAHHSQEQIQEGPAYGELNLWFWGG